MTAAARSAKPRSGALERVVRRMAEIALVVVIAVIAARAIWFVVYGPEAWRADIAPEGAPTLAAASGEVEWSALSRLNLFAARGLAPVEAALPETRLNLTLRGVRRGANAASGSAVIEAPGQGQRTIPVGGEISDGVALAEVHEDRVVIDRRGVREKLFLRQETTERRATRLIRPAGDPAASAAGTPNTAAPQTAAAPLPEDWPEDWIEALRLRRVEAGFEITAPSGAAVLDRLSLNTGDVITEIDGRSIARGRNALDLLEDLQDADSALLTLSRDGRTVRIEVSVR